MTLKNAKLRAKRWIRAFRTKRPGWSMIPRPLCAQCVRPPEIPKDILNIAKTGRCGYHLALMTLPPSYRKEVDEAVQKARGGYWFDLINLLKESKREK